MKVIDFGVPLAMTYRSRQPAGRRVFGTAATWRPAERPPQPEIRPFSSEKVVVPKAECYDSSFDLRNIVACHAERLLSGTEMSGLGSKPPRAAPYVFFSAANVSHTSPPYS
jgi:hypothetical protein